jgi:feruloyl esterase
MMNRTQFQRALAYLLVAAPCIFLSAQAATAADTQPLNLPAVAAVMDCAALASTDISRAVGAPTVIKSAAVVDDGKVAAYCKVQIEIDDAYAKFQLNLPVSAWTQRLLFGGGPGAQVAPGAVRMDQFVTASWQDLGRRSQEDVFADNYQARVNSAYRSMHQQVVAAKALIAKYYGQAQKFAYYNACSWPGREGMMNVQRYPEDFDGVGAGCPPINLVINNGLFQAWNVLTNTAADGKPIITADKLPILHQLALDQCDAADSAKDGIISDPLACHLNVKAAQCKAGQDAGTCLTAAQVHAAEELYRGAHDDKGNKLTPIGVLPGSELAWTATIIPGGRNPKEARDQTTTAIRSQFYSPALPKTWELGDLKFDRTTFAAETKLHYLWDATNPDLSGFAKAGHKLILWQGMGDTNVLPAHAVLWYTALRKEMGEKVADSFVRFYALPGVYHCGGGDGPVITDLLPSLMAWVERDVAPGALNGSHTVRRPGQNAQGAGVAGGPGAAGARQGGPGGPGGAPAGAGAAPQMPPAPVAPAAPDLTRPIYPYPYIAKYVGTGSVTDGANFVQGPARPAPAELFKWLGSNFYAAQTQKWCTGNSTGLDCKNSR